jgi:hypothetical protein
MKTMETKERIRTMEKRGFGIPKDSGVRSVVLLTIGCLARRGRALKRLAQNPVESLAKPSVSAGFEGKNGSRKTLT